MAGDQLVFDGMTDHLAELVRKHRREGGRVWHTPDGDTILGWDPEG
jgi:hypothetical protein